MCISYALDLLINTIDFHPGQDFKKFSTRGNGAASTNGQHFGPAAHLELILDSITRHTLPNLSPLKLELQVEYQT